VSYLSISWPLTAKVLRELHSPFVLTIRKDMHLSSCCCNWWVFGRSGVRGKFRRHQTGTLSPLVNHCAVTLF